MSYFGKIKSAADSYLSQYKTANPAAYAAAQQAIGGVLILDGLVGIDNPLGGRKRKGIVGSLGGVLAGIFILLVSGFFGSVMGLKDMTAMTTADVVSVNREYSRNSDGSAGSSTCSARVRYTVDGKEYEQQSSFSSNTLCALTQGSNVPISYNPNRPGSWAYDIKSMNLMMMIFPAIGGLLIVSSLVTFIIRLLSILFGWKLLKSGRALAATLPAGTNLSTVVNEIKQQFTHQLFGFSQPAMQPVSAPVVSQPVFQSQPQFQSAQPSAPIGSQQPLGAPAYQPAPAAPPLPVQPVTGAGDAGTPPFQG